MQECVLCQLIENREIKKIYEDDSAIVVLEVNPVVLGHCLIIPKKHYEIMPQLEDIGSLFIVAKKISHTLLRALKCQGTNIFVANGITANQRYKHFVIDVIPRFDNDGLTTFAVKEKNIILEDYTALKDAVMAQL